MQPVKVDWEGRTLSVGLQPYIAFCSSQNEWLNLFCTLWESNNNQMNYCLNQLLLCWTRCLTLVRSWAVLSPWYSVALYKSDVLFWLRKKHARLKITHTLQSFHSEYVFYTLYLYIYAKALPTSSLVVVFSKGIAVYTDAIKLSLLHEKTITLIHCRFRKEV